jgi:hypothetical protein
MKQLGVANAIALVGTAVAAGLWGIAVLVTGVMGTVNMLVAESIRLPQPVKTPAEVAIDPDAAVQLVEATNRSADIEIAGASTVIRSLLASSWALDTVMHLAIVVGLIALSVALLRGRPFVPNLRRVLMGVSLALVVGGLGSAGLLGFANMEVAAALDAPGFPVMAEFDLTAPLIGLVLAVVVIVFEFGERLQRDTEGLV